MRSREDGDLVGRQAAPQLPEIRLDAAMLGREVVRDEQMAHSSASTSALISVDEREEVGASGLHARPTCVSAQGSSGSAR